MQEPHIPSITIDNQVAVYTTLPGRRINRFFHPHRLALSCFIIVRRGTLDMNINLFNIRLKKNDIAFLFFGSIIQVNHGSDDFHAEIIAFSPGFLKDIDLIKTILPHLATVHSHVIIPLKEKDLPLVLEFYHLFSKMYQRLDASKDGHTQIMHHMLSAFLHSAVVLYEQDVPQAELRTPSRQEQITRDLLNLVVQYYREERSVHFYAGKLSITAKHLSLTIRKVMNKTVSDIIAEAVILDAKSQLKSLTHTIQEISDSLNFADQSFFGKYFKRYTGMSPKKYRETVHTERN